MLLQGNLITAMEPWASLLVNALRYLIYDTIKHSNMFKDALVSV